LEVRYNLALLDIEIVRSFISPLLNESIVAEEIDSRISEVIRCSNFATAWNRANLAIFQRVPRTQLRSPIVPADLKSTLGVIQPELQSVADAWASVVRDVESGGSLRPEMAAITLERTELPRYLDDDSMPIEVWAALRARDVAAVSYLALIEGHTTSGSPRLMLEYAKRHCKYQKQWIDLLSWMFCVKRPALLSTSEQQPWESIFEEHESAERGLKTLIEQARSHPDGVVLSHLLPVERH
jgi:hypothetical protein